MAGRFTPSRERIPNLGITRSTYWARFTVRSQAPTIDEWRITLRLINFGLVDCYAPAADGYRVTRTGNRRPFSTRDLAHRRFVFRLPLEVAAQKTVHLRFGSSDSMILPLRLSSPEAFARRDRAEFAFLGAIYGILAVALVVSLFAVVAMRGERLYLYYSLFLAGFLAFSATIDGLAQQLLIPEVTFVDRLIIAFACST